MISAVTRTHAGVVERLKVWLKYDPSRAEEAEAAYSSLITKGRLGVWIVVGFVGFLVLLDRFHVPARQVGNVGEIALCAGPAISLCFLSRGTLARIFCGAVDWKRACLLGIGLGLVAISLEILLGAILATFGMHGTRNFNPLSSGLLLGILAAVVAAPFGEELLMQGWLQTRLTNATWLPTGGDSKAWAAAQFTTVAFVLLHTPQTLTDWLIAIGLGFAAALRATTRSMAACMVIHATMNGAFVLVTVGIPFLIAQGFNVPGFLR